MKRLLAVAFALAACTGSTEPPAPLAIAGYYTLVSINGQPIPFQESSGGIVTGGGLTIAADSGWTVGDTTSNVIGGTLFRWGGVVIPDGSSYVFKDSLRAGVRYTGTVDGKTFTLVSSRTYRYQRQP